MVLLTGGCLAASGLRAGENSTAVSAPKPAARTTVNFSHPATPHPAAKAAGTSPHASHVAARGAVTAHPGPARSSTVRSTAHAPAASASHRAPNHPAAHSSQHTYANARYRRTRPLNSWQRLSRLHLEPERIQEIQQALSREGYYQGEANGQWDARTHDAMLRYQTDHGFPATGLPEAKSLMKLGLGSHPLPAELDHGTVGAAAPAAITPGAAAGDLTPTSPSPPVSQALPPS